MSVTGLKDFWVDLVSKDVENRLKRKRLESEEEARLESKEVAEKHVEAESSAGNTTAVRQKKRRKVKKKK